MHACDFVILSTRRQRIPTLSTTIKNGKVETLFHLCQSLHCLRREAGHFDPGEAVTNFNPQG